jgi:hypothetical protein
LIEKINNYFDDLIKKESQQTEKKETNIPTITINNDDKLIVDGKVIAEDTDILNDILVVSQKDIDDLKHTEGTVSLIKYRIENLKKQEQIKQAKSISVPKEYEQQVKNLFAQQPNDPLQTSNEKLDVKPIEDIKGTYNKKDANKFKNTTKLISHGVSGSSSEKYNNIAKKQGKILPLVQDERKTFFNSNDIVGISTNGKSRYEGSNEQKTVANNAWNQTIQDIDLAIESGVYRFITDSEHHTNRSFNNFSIIQ